MSSPARPQHPASYWRCMSCTTVGVGDGGAERHTRSAHHPTETTSSRARFAQWQAEAEAKARGAK